MTTNHLILDFSHVYCDEKIPRNDKVHWLDCSDITECDLYCSKRAEEEIRARIAPYGIHGIHFLDSGNYHYVTGIMTALIKQKFSLILLDHHTDMQKPMIEQMTSCGDWAGKVLKTNPWLQQLILIGPQESDILQIYREKEGLVSGAELQEKLITFSEEEIQSVDGENKISGIKGIFRFIFLLTKIFWMKNIQRQIGVRENAITCAGTAADAIFNKRKYPGH